MGRGLIRSAGTHWLLLLALWLSPAFGHAAAILDLDARLQPVPLRDWGDTWIDTTGKATISEVAALPMSQVEQVFENRRYDLPQGQALWIRLAIPAAPDSERWYLKLARPGLDYVDLYTRGSDGQWIVMSAGDRVPVADWPLPNVYPIFPLRVSAEEPTYYALRIQSSQSFDVPISFENDSRLSTTQQRKSLLLGFYFGLLMMVAGFALCTSIVMREPVHAFFGLWAGAATLALASTYGVSGMHLWPTMAEWNHASKYVLPVLSLIPLLAFTATAISLHARQPVLYWAFLALSVAVAAVTGIVATTEGDVRISVTVGATAFVALVCLAATIRLIFMGDRFAGWLLLGFLPLAGALLVFAAHALQWTPHSLLMRCGPAVALGMALPLIFLLLMVRGRERRDYQRRISQIDRVDPATGLVNDLVFTHRMRVMIDRAHKMNHQCMVVVLDLSNRHDILNDFGRRSSLKVVLKLAERLTTFLRDADTVARLGDSRFGLLIEGPVPTDRLNSMSTKILSRCITPFTGLPVGLVLKPKIAALLVPLNAATPESALDLLDAMLTETPGNQKKSIFTLGSQTSAPATLAS